MSLIVIVLLAVYAHTLSTLWTDWPPAIYFSPLVFVSHLASYPRAPYWEGWSGASCTLPLPNNTPLQPGMTTLYEIRLSTTSILEIYIKGIAYLISSVYILSTWMQNVSIIILKVLFWKRLGSLIHIIGSSYAW